MNEDRTKRKLTAIFSADVVGYSRLMEEDEAWTIQNLEENKRLISKLIEEYQGRVIDSPGDNLLAEFNSVINAVECAVKIQQALKKKNDNLIESRRMHFRIGINLGDVVEEDGRIYGSGVNIAARLEGLTDPGGICISRRTYDHVKTRLDLGYEYLGEHNVKNISEPVRVYRVLMGSENAGKVIGEKKASKMISRRLAVTTFIALIFIAAGSLVWNIYSNQPRKIEQASEPEQAPAVVNEEETPKTIAVIPFENLSSDPEQENFVDGLSEELLNCLSNISGLRVTSRTSSFAFKNTDKTLQEVAGVLGVENILEGSVRKAGDNLRITAQLIRVKDDSHLWSNTYDRELKDIFAIQEEIATAVADELKVTLGVGDSLKQLGGTDNVEAYEFYLYALSGGNPSRNDEGLGSPYKAVDSAIALDPDYALAWALKAYWQEDLAMHSSPNQAASEYENALISARKAIELEPNLPEAYASLGSIQSAMGDWIEAAQNYSRALELSVSPSWLDSYSMYLFAVGYFEQANKNLKNALQSDPLNDKLRINFLTSFALLGNKQQVEQEIDHTTALFGDQYHKTETIKAHLALGDYVPKDEIQDLFTGYSNVEVDLHNPENGIKELNRYVANNVDLEVGILNSVALVAANLGDYELTMKIIEKIATESPKAIFFAWFPIMHDMRQLPRFKKLVREIGLVDYWNQFGWPDICRPLENGDFECD